MLGFRRSFDIGGAGTYRPLWSEQEDEVSMGYDLKPRDRRIDWFHMGAFSWGHLMEVIGPVFPCIHDGKGKWYCVFGVDKRMPLGDDYPRHMSNDGMRVTAGEARWMARLARNYCAIQKSLPDPPEVQAADRQMSDIWPRKIRSDFVDLYLKFADWAEKSMGFRIY